MRRKVIFVVLAGFFALAIAGPALTGEEKMAALNVIKIAEKEGVNPKEKFASYYEPVKYEAEAKIKPYKLPLDLEKIGNYEALAKKIKLNDRALALLKQNGFTVVPYISKGCDDIVKPYDDLKKREVPIFVTSDTLLHLYHIQFDETLKDIEEREFYPDLAAMSKAMYEASKATFDDMNGKKDAGLDYYDVVKAWKRNAVFFAVALSILEEPQEITVESLEKMKPEDFADFMQKVQKLSESRRYKGAWGALKYSGRREKESLKIIVAEYEKAVKAGIIKIEKPTEFPDWVKRAVEKERALIEGHKGFEVSPLFKYKEDYSQYVPRGHYTRRFILEKYFKAMMWYGRLTFLINYKLISPEDAKIQTLQAALISGIVNQVMAGKRSVADIWNRIYTVTAYYVGVADDLTLYEYREVMRKVYGGGFTTIGLLEEKKWFEFRKGLALLRPPAIYSGTGEIVLAEPPGIASEEDLKKALEATKGLRFMGQRYIPDSYMMGKLVYPTIGKPMPEAKGCFTLVMTDLGPARGFPRGLDVMAVLGSKRARAILDEEKDSKYDKYDETMKKLRDEFSKFGGDEWNRNLYWSWLYSLKALIEPAGKGTQTFMQTDAWQDKQLNAALASWAELRHDTILYAKQSYTMRATSVPVRPKLVEGYVEPVPEFYARMLAMTKMTLKGLDDMKVLDDKAKRRLGALENILQQLLDISVKELAGKQLTKKEYAFIRNFGENLDAIITGVASRGKETTMIADVHTDQNTKKCLEEGVGYVKMIVVAYRMPDGGIIMGAGPVMSYYEFKHPMKDRLTDEKWKAMLKAGKAPAQPKWTGSFSNET